MYFGMDSPKKFCVQQKNHISVTFYVNLQQRCFLSDPTCSPQSLIIHLLHPPPSCVHSTPSHSSCFCSFHLTSVRRLICLGGELNISKVVSGRNLEKRLEDAFFWHPSISSLLTPRFQCYLPHIYWNLPSQYPAQYFPTRRLTDPFFASYSPSSCSSSPMT